MRTANPLTVMRRRRRQAWEDVVAEYLDRPVDFWGPDRHWHADKLTRRAHAVATRDGLSPDAVVDAVIEMAADRRSGRPPPVYVTGLGGTGTVWLADMLGELRGLAPAGEVYYPGTLRDAIHALDDVDQAAVIDAVHLLHAWAHERDVRDAGLVNAAAGVGKVATWKRWDPDALAIHVVRDPREQVVDVTFRNRAFRRAEAPTADDTLYLRRMVGRAMRSCRDARASVDAIDAEWRYEELIDDPRPLLRQVMTLRGRQVDEQQVSAAAVRHAGDRPERDPLPRLDELVDPDQRRLLHTGLVEAVHGMGYPPADCMGMPPPRAMGMALTPRTVPARTLGWAAHAPGPCYQRVDGQWVPTESTAGVRIAAGVPVLLRIGPDDPGPVSAVAGFGPADVQMLCLAGHRGVDDDTLAALATLRDLVTLDLAATAITDTGLRHLEAMTGLRQLHVDDTRTTPQGRRALIERLPNLTVRP